MIYWMPHAESENILNGDLTTLGYNQAHKAALWLQDKQIRHIITSTDDDSRYTEAIIRHVLTDTTSHADSHLDIIANTPTREALIELARMLESITQTTLIITRPNSIMDLLPRLCINAAALQRVATPHPTGIILLERYNAGRYICHAWDLREHLQ